MEKLIRSLEFRLPSNVSPRFLAQTLLGAVTEASPATMLWRQKFGPLPSLAAIKPGAAHATRYHRTIFKALEAIFDGVLSNGQVEQEINSGIHRVDIMFDNPEEHGFFGYVRTRLELKADYLPVECKNYSDDLSSSEYDQLSGRLNKERQVGLLVFRKIKDHVKALEHVKAKWAKQELIIMLDDEDILRLYKARHDGQISEVNSLLRSKVRSLKLNSSK